MAIGGDGNGTGQEIGWGTDSDRARRADDHGRNLTTNGGNEARRGNINLAAITWATRGADYMVAM
jgi:hypothetical protein